MANKYHAGSSSSSSSSSSRGSSNARIATVGSASSYWAPKLKSTYHGMKAPKTVSGAARGLTNAEFRALKSVDMMKKASAASRAGKAVARGAAKTAGKQAQRRAAIGMGGKASSKLLGGVAGVAMAAEAGWTAGKAIKRGVRGSNDKKIASQKKQMNKLGKRRVSVNKEKRITAIQQKQKRNRLPKRKGLPTGYDK